MVASFASPGVAKLPGRNFDGAAREPSSACRLCLEGQGCCSVVNLTVLSFGCSGDGAVSLPLGGVMICQPGRGELFRAHFSWRSLGGFIGGIFLVTFFLSFFLV